MKVKVFLFILPFFVLVSFSADQTAWKTEKQKGYLLSQKSIDKKSLAEYNLLVKNGLKEIKSFFGNSFKKGFTVYVHANRHSLDSCWQADWKMPDFKSECWMVASGVATRLDLLAPKKWEKESCEHNYKDKIKSQKIITHELFHVYHGQLNASPDFSATEGLDWFVEGLATYASGQCDSFRVSEIKKAIADNKVPGTLDKFWSGKMKYGLSGSVVMYIDKKFGRKKLAELLPFAKKTEVLSALKISEEELLKGWREYLLTL